LATHNALVPLLRRRYLEIIAIDPDAPPPTMTRWFGLDEPAVQAQLATGPKLLAYVVRGAAIPTRPSGFPALAPQSAQRASFSWTFGFIADGKRPGNGALPYFIAWDARSAHPCDALPPAQYDLHSVDVSTPDAAAQLAAILPFQLADVAIAPGPVPTLRATLSSPHRTFTLVS
jgi:hypothetical protein